MTGEEVLKHLINPEYTEYKMKKQTTKQKVLKLLSEGMKPKDVAAKMKIKPQQVYVIKSEAKKKMELPGQVVFVKNSSFDNIHFSGENGLVKLKSTLDMKEGFAKNDHPLIYRSEEVILKKSFFQKLKEFMGL